MSEPAGSEHNPFASPNETEVAAGTAVFSPVAVAIHAFFFTPFFGGAVAAMNWVAVGRPKRAAQVLGLGTVALGLGSAVGAAMPIAYVGIALLFSTVLYFEQQMLRRHWPELPLVGITINLMVALCFVLAGAAACVVLAIGWVLV